MKRILAILTIVAAIAAVPHSARAEFRYAPVVGLNITNLTFKQDLIGVDQRVGFQAGIQGELMFPGIGFGIDFGLLYNQAGAKVDLGEREIWKSQGFSRSDVLLHQLTIPVHVRFKWTRMNGLEDYIAPFVYGGPDFNINIAHSRVRGNEGVPNPFSYTGGDLGLSVGGGFELWRRWQVSVQYTWGMTYLLKTRLLDDFSARGRQWSVRVAYFF